jgi:hypothetical protein
MKRSVVKYVTFFGKKQYTTRLRYEVAVHALVAFVLSAAMASASSQSSPSSLSISIGVPTPNPPFYLHRITIPTLLTFARSVRISAADHTPYHLLVLLVAALRAKIVLIPPPFYEHLGVIA